MPETPATTTAGKGGFWTHKLGPFPVWVWGVGLAAVGGYYWYTHYGPGSKQQQQQAQPATRIGTINEKITENITTGGGRKAKTNRRKRKVHVIPVHKVQLPKKKPQPGSRKRGGGGTGPPPRPLAAQPSPGGPAQPAPSAGLQPGGPVSAATAEPVYAEWLHITPGQPVPEPTTAYAPMTSGATYDAASAAAALG